MKYDLHFTTDQTSVAFVLFAVGEIIRQDTSGDFW